MTHSETDRQDKRDNNYSNGPDLRGHLRVKKRRLYWLNSVTKMTRKCLIRFPILDNFNERRKKEDKRWIEGFKNIEGEVYESQIMQNGMMSCFVYFIQVKNIVDCQIS